MVTLRPLSLREQIFIREYEAHGGGRGAGTPAAIAAGYAARSAAVMSSRLLQREPVRRELEKRQKARLRALHSKAIDVLEETLDDKSDPPTRLRAANQVLHRVDPPVASTAHRTDINMTIRQEPNDRLGLKIVELGRRIGWTSEMIQRALGPNTDLLQLERQVDGRASEPGPVTIDAVPVEVLDDDAGDDDNGDV
jgi:hypothetical protein